MTDVAMYGVSWVSEDLSGLTHHSDDGEVRGWGCNDMAALRVWGGITLTCEAQGALIDGRAETEVQLIMRCRRQLTPQTIHPSTRPSLHPPAPIHPPAHPSTHPQHPVDVKDVKHVGPMTKNLLPAGKKLPAKRSVK